VNQDKNLLTLKRILVPLDASEHSMAALNTAAGLAAAQGAELEGLFVEDINLLQLCEFPFIREISFWGHTFRCMNRADTERQLRMRARQLKRILAEVATRHDVSWKFKVTRGGVPAEVLAAAEDADLTILGRSGWTMTRPRITGSTVRTVVSRGRGMTMIIQKGMRFQPPVQALFTGSELSEKALNVALDLGKKKDISILVYLLTDGGEKLKDMRGRVEEITSAKGVRASVQSIRAMDLKRISRTVRAYGPGPLFIPCEEPNLQGEDLQELINSLDNPVFLVR